MGASLIATPCEPVIAIVGAGISGTLLAVNLLREDGPKVVLIEREPRRVARGIAYATTDSAHLLNVRAANMSAFPDQPDHFLNWLNVEDADRNRFVSRQVYGDYIEDLLVEALSKHSARLQLVYGPALAAHRTNAGWEIEIAGREVVKADILILAQGNLPPAGLPVFSDIGPPLYQSDPWRHGAAGLGDQDQVLLIGTGLTAVDVALSLVRRGFEGKIHALSRRGLKPRSHVEQGPYVDYVDRPTENGSWLVRRLRTRASEVGWRLAIDELRLHNRDIWRRMDSVERQRFLRHIRPFWDVHRHRLAPGVAAQINAMEASGQLQFLAGKIEQVELSNDVAKVDWRRRGKDEIATLTVKRIINCTGPLGDLLKCDDPLILGLLSQGVLRLDQLKLGIDVDAQSRALDATGRIQDDMLAIGPMARGEAWETIAVPDIRRQVWDIARRLTDSQWVEVGGL